MNLFKLLKISDKLAKTGQYMTIPDWILNAKDESKVMASVKRNKAKNILQGRGKIDPAHMKQLIDNRHTDIWNVLKDRTDLTSDNLFDMINSTNEFAYPLTNYATRTSHQHKIIKALHSNAKTNFDFDFSKVISEGTDEGITQSLKAGSFDGSHLFKIIANKPVLARSNISQILSHPDYDEGHAVELLRLNDKTVSRSVLGNNKNRNGKQQENNILNTFLNSPQEHIDKTLSEALLRSMPTETQRNQMVIGNDEVKTKIAGHTNDPEIFKYIHENLMDHPGHEMLAAAAKHDTHDRSDKEFTQEPDFLRSLTDQAISRKSDTILGELAKNPNLPTDSITKILDSGLEIPLTVKENLSTHKNSATDDYHKIIDQTNEPESIKKLARSIGKSDDIEGGLASELMQKLWNKYPTESKSEINTHRWSSSDGVHPWAESNHTPGGIIKDIYDNYMIDPKDTGLQNNILSHKNFPQDSLASVITHANPNVRAMAAKNPNLSSDDIMRGLKDRNKAVRAKFIGRDDLSEAHFAQASKDKVAANKELVLQNQSLPNSVLNQIASTTPLKNSRKVLEHTAFNRNTLSAMVQRSQFGEEFPGLSGYSDDYTLNAIFNKADTQNFESIIDNVNFSHPTVQRALSYLDDKSSFNAISKQHYGKVVDDFQKFNAPLTADIVGHPHTNPEIVKAFTRNAESYELNKLVATNSPNLSSNDIMEVFKKQPTSNAFYEAASRHSNTPHKAILENLLSSRGGHSVSRYITNGIPESGPSDDIKHMLIDRLDPENIGQILGGDIFDNKMFSNFNEANTEYLKNKLGSLTPEHYQSSADLLGEVRGVIDNFMRLSPTVANDEHVDFFKNHSVTGLRTEDYDSEDIEHDLDHQLIRNPMVSEDRIRKLMRSSNPRIAEKAAEKILHHDPDAYNKALEDGHTVEVHPVVEKLKYLKGLVNEAGGILHKKELEKKGHPVPYGQLLDGKGNMTPQSIDGFLDTFPKAKFNVSYGKWNSGDMQMHDDSKDQAVVQLNITNDHIKQMKDQGIYDVFKKMQDLSKRSGHPVRGHTLGWARVDQSAGDHWHIDEIQSDLSTGTIRYLEKQQKNGQMSEADATSMKNGVGKMMKIFKGPYKSINHAISGAVHQIARDKGVKSTSFDMPKDQAAQSHMNTNKKLPGHMMETYSQIPKGLKYEQDYPKKNVMPDHNSDYETVQFRKLTKSLAFVVYLMKKLNN